MTKNRSFYRGTLAARMDLAVAMAGWADNIT